MLDDQQARPSFPFAKSPLRGTEAVYEAVQTRVGFRQTLIREIPLLLTEIHLNILH
jgi:hypothetical protein